MRMRLRIMKAGGLLLDRNLEHGAGQAERAADRQRLVVLPRRGSQ
jgi:hypothetical protein